MDCYVVKTYGYWFEIWCNTYVFDNYEKAKELFDLLVATAKDNRSEVTDNRKVIIKDSEQRCEIYLDGWYAYNHHIIEISKTVIISEGDTLWKLLCSAI